MAQVNGSKVLYGLCPVRHASSRKVFMCQVYKRGLCDSVFLSSEERDVKIINCVACVAFEESLG